MAFDLFGGSKRSRGARSGKKLRQQSVIQLNAEEQTQIEILKSQLTSVFSMFDTALAEALSNSPKQDVLLSLNDVLTATLMMFGKSCQGHKQKRNDKILCAVFADFQQKKRKLRDVDQQILGAFLQFTEAALTAQGPLPELKISAQAMNVRSEDILSFLPGLFGKFLGSNHHTTALTQEVRGNTARFQRDNDEAISATKDLYAQKRSSSRFPSQNAMYNLSGGGKNVRFGAEQGAGRANYDAKDGDNEMDLDDEVAVAHRSTNALILKAPKQLKRLNHIPYPMPCEIVAELPEGRTFNIMLAEPYRITVKNVNKKNLSFDRETVRAQERVHFEFLKQMLGEQGAREKGLGYLSVDNIDAAFQ